ncbi:hypothetical protein [Streptomyces minutiscleroticus]|uniref:Uncharacterized protein n=1 Tax=Streptomyces minutiscleroticus TaxID=68238 RepID=A0A918KSS7_9ACTN|nr:hypothetical protein [Streptomyces minutiscleroticus]GGX74616.1 hypothetical protein GCM10010358_31280 [Streptomyces minutiscleroticus]
MGWTHDYSDAARNRRPDSGLTSYQRSTPQVVAADPRVGIPHILRRRARWVSARLRHPKD